MYYDGGSGGNYFTRILRLYKISETYHLEANPVIKKRSIIIKSACEFFLFLSLLYREW